MNEVRAMANGKPLDAGDIQVKQSSPIIRHVPDLFTLTPEFLTLAIPMYCTVACTSSREPLPVALTDRPVLNNDNDDNNKTLEQAKEEIRALREVISKMGIARCGCLEETQPRVRCGMLLPPSVP